MMWLDLTSVMHQTDGESECERDSYIFRAISSSSKSTCVTFTESLPLLSHICKVQIVHKDGKTSTNDLIARPLLIARQFNLRPDLLIRSTRCVHTSFVLLPFLSDTAEK
jgi:hypothetical protein